MNCETIPLLLNAAIDGELTADERDTLELHLSHCNACGERAAELRALDTLLGRTLGPQSADSVVDRVLSEISASGTPTSVDRSMICSPASDIAGSNSTGGKGVRRSVAATRRSATVILMLVSTVVIVATVISGTSGTSTGIGEITMATGPIEVMRENAREWTYLNVAAHTRLPAHARIRTQGNSLCEIRTTADTLIRLNAETELVLHRSERVELVSGEMWCRAPDTTSLEISTKRSLQRPMREMAMTCPSSSETQWQALGDQETRCLAVSPASIEVKMEQPKFGCTVNPGDTLAIRQGDVPATGARADLFQALSWQLPLLVLKSPDDLELRRLLTQLLARVGQSKMRSLYDEQIRSLGPAGTIPLLAYVRSAESSEQPELRHRAMQVIVELAPASSIAELEKLLDDPDPVVKRLSSMAMRRLAPVNHNRE